LLVRTDIFLILLPGSSLCDTIFLQEEIFAPPAGLKRPRRIPDRASKSETDMTRNATSPRHPNDYRLPLEGAVNFRDLGGYPTSDGRRLRKGMVFRSDHLSRLTPRDHQLLSRLRFKLVCDFRTVQEQRLAPDRLPEDGSCRLFHLPVQVSGFDPATVMDRLRAGDASWLTMDFMVELYRRYLDEFGPVWGQVLRLAAAPENLPLVFHCTGGKDRTGICAALLLLVLGVPEETVLHDHDRSNACNAERLPSIYAQFSALGITPQQSASYLQAPAEPLLAMLEHLRHAYGSADQYLRTKAGLTEGTLKILRARLLE
jgi:protein-tyrosine phosphatase